MAGSFQISIDSDDIGPVEYRGRTNMLCGEFVKWIARPIADCATCTGTRCQPRGKEFLRVKVSLARTKHTRWAMYLRVDGLDHAAELIL